MTDAAHGEDWIGEFTWDPAAHMIGEFNISPFSALGDQTAEIAGGHGDDPFAIDLKAVCSVGDRGSFVIGDNGLLVDHDGLLMSGSKIVAGRIEKEACASQEGKGRSQIEGRHRESSPPLKIKKRENGQEANP